MAHDLFQDENLFLGVIVLVKDKSKTADDVFGSVFVADANENTKNITKSRDIIPASNYIKLKRKIQQFQICKQI